MLTPQQIESIRARNGITVKDSSAENRVAELDAAWGRTAAEAPKVETKGEGVLREAGQLGKNIFNIGVGATKGVANTIATVPQAVNKVVAATTEIKTGKKYTEALEAVNKSNDQILGVLKTLPEGDPKREKYLNLLKDNQKLASEITNDRAEMDAQLSGLTEKPEFTKPYDAPEGLASDDPLRQKERAQKFGFYGEKLGEFVAAGKGVAEPLAQKATGAVEATKLAPAAKKALEIGAGAASEGVAAGAVTAAQGEGIKETSRAAILATALSVPFKAFEVLQKPASEMLEQSAQRKVTQALNPTTKENKEIAEKIVPEMLKRRVKFIGKEGLQLKAAANAEIVGEQIGKSFDNLPPDTKVVISPIIKEIEEEKLKLVIKGTKTVPSAAAPQYQAFQNIQKEIIDLADPVNVDDVATQAIKRHFETGRQIIKEMPDAPINEVIERTKINIVDGLKGEGKKEVAKIIDNLNPASYKTIDDFYAAVDDSLSNARTISAESLRSFRQILDRVIKGAKGGFGLTGKESARLAAQKEMANSIRKTMADDFPEIAKLNKEYTFWKNVEKVVGDTITRTKGQSSVSQSISEATGAVIGSNFLQGGLKDTVLGVLGFRMLKKVMASATWRNTSGLVRQQLADYIVSGNSKAALQLIERLLIGGASTKNLKENE